MTRFVRSAILLSVISSLAVACAPPAREESTISRAYRLIDAQRSDEAIMLLEKSTRANPKDTEAQVALASAYSHKAGIKIQKLWKLVQMIKGSSFLTAVAGEMPNDAAGADKIDATLGQYAQLLHRIARMAELYVAIPNVAPDKRAYLNQSLVIMNALDNPRKGDIVFRLILKIVQFKSQMAAHMMPEPGTKSTSFLGETCSVDFERANVAVIEQAKLMIGILDDAVLLFPETEKMLLEARMKIASNTSNLTSGLTSLIVFDTGSSQLLKSSMIDNNFGKLLKCGGAQH